MLPAKIPTISSAPKRFDIWSKIHQFSECYQLAPCHEGQNMKMRAYNA